MKKSEPVERERYLGDNLWVEQTGPVDIRLRYNALNAFQLVITMNGDQLNQFCHYLQMYRLPQIEKGET